jgi:glyoxylase-like metal-dependent hydrolase (beta-lactamase superfamily II)
MQYKVLNLLPEFETNTYLVWDELSGEAVIIDPAMPSQDLLDFISKQSLTVKYIINTHGHADHIGGNAYFHQKTNAPVCIHKDDAAMLENSKLNLSAFLNAEVTQPGAQILLQDRDTLRLGEKTLQMIHTPGHTKGGICIMTDNLLFSGDTLFRLDVGRTDLPGGDFEALKSSIRTKLFNLDDALIVLPGHGPASTIGNEKKLNPYL